jgi:hypothetical protein
MHVFVTDVPSAAAAVVDRCGTNDKPNKTNIPDYLRIRSIALVKLVCVFQSLTTKMQVNTILT